ncbi:MAG: fibronectin type III domain-containing protein [Spirochaetales bacterium]|nr:fibronectin type III domain-containing protein [Spirochaetales bacterium]
MRDKIFYFLAVCVAFSLIFSCDKTPSLIQQFDVVENEGSAFISWERPANSVGEVLYYGLKGDSVPLGKIELDNAKPDGTSISGLENGREYYVKIYAVTASGQSFLVGEKTFTPKVNSKDASAVVALIESIPAVEEIVLDNEPLIVSARNAYNKLRQDYKDLVTNLGKLLEAEARVKFLQASAEDQAAASAVIAKIEALPELDLIAASDREAFLDVRESYNSLTVAQKEFVHNYEKLAGFASAFVNSDEVIVLVEAIPAEITFSDLPLLSQAFNAFNNLKENEKTLVPQELRDRLLSVKVYYVDLLLQSLPVPAEMTLMDEALVKSVRAEYEALSPEEKYSVDALNKLFKLEDAEICLVELKIDAISEILSLDDCVKIKEAWSAYGSLSATFQDKVRNFTQLQGAADGIAGLSLASPTVTERTSYDSITVSWDSVEGIDGYVLYHSFIDSSPVDLDALLVFSEDLPSFELDSSRRSLVVGSESNKVAAGPNYFWVRFFMETPEGRTYSGLSDVSERGARDITDEEWVTEVNRSIYEALKPITPIPKPSKSGLIWSDDNGWSGRVSAYGGYVTGYRSEWSNNYSRGYVLEDVTSRYLSITGYMADLYDVKNGGDKPRNVRVTAGGVDSGASEFITISGLYPGEFRYHMHVNTENMDADGGPDVYLGSSANGVCAKRDCTVIDSEYDYLWARRTVPGFRPTHSDTPYQIKRDGATEATDVVNTPAMWAFYPN